MEHDPVKDAKIECRVSPDKKRQYQRDAKKAGHRDLSKYLVSLLDQNSLVLNVKRTKP